MRELLKKIHPLYLTVFGLTLVPFIIISQQIGGVGGLSLCFAMLLLREAADLADGRLARFTNQVTNLGKLLDPLADSIAKISAFFGFVALGWMDVWMLAAISLRDLIVAYIRAFAASFGIIIPARWSGKYLHALPQSIAIITIVFGYLLVECGMELPMEEISWTLLFVATLLTVFTLFDYIFAAFTQIKAKKVTL